MAQSRVQKVLKAGTQSFARFIRSSLAWVLPLQCPRCQIVLEVCGLCPDCWMHLTFFSGSCCIVCGHPFPLALETDTLCAQCYREPPAFKSSLSVLQYDDYSKRLILPFKYGHDLSLLPLLTQLLFQRGQPLFQEGTLVIPVPLHWTRLWKRRFNQSALLAQSLSRKAGLSYEPMLLRRIRRTPSQGGLTAKQRAENMKGAFSVAPSQGSLLRGARVLLVDDVYTTGETLQACARALHPYGVAYISTLTLAKVVR